MRRKSKARRGRRRIPPASGEGSEATTFVRRPRNMAYHRARAVVSPFNIHLFPLITPARPVIAQVRWFAILSPNN